MKLLNFIDDITALPGRVSRTADSVNDYVIDRLREIQGGIDQAGSIAEENLRQNKIESLGRQAATWLSNPVNLSIAGIGFAVFILLIVKISRGN